MNTSDFSNDRNHIDAYCFTLTKKSSNISEFRIIFEFYDSAPVIVIHNFKFICNDFAMNFIVATAAALYIRGVFKKIGTIHTANQAVAIVIAKGGKTKSEYKAITELFKKVSHGITSTRTPSREMPDHYDLIEHTLMPESKLVEKLISLAARKYLLKTTPV